MRFLFVAFVLGCCFLLQGCVYTLKEPVFGTGGFVPIAGVFLCPGPGHRTDENGETITTETKISLTEKISGALSTDYIYDLHIYDDKYTPGIELRFMQIGPNYTLCNIDLQELAISISYKLMDLTLLQF